MLNALAFNFKNCNMRSIKPTLFSICMSPGHIIKNNYSLPYEYNK